MKKNCSIGSDELNSSCRIPSTLKTIQIAGFVEFLPFMDWEKKFDFFLDAVVFITKYFFIPLLCSHSNRGIEIHVKDKEIQNCKFFS